MITFFLYRTDVVIKFRFTDIFMKKSALYM